MYRQKLKNPVYTAKRTPITIQCFTREMNCIDFYHVLYPGSRIVEVPHSVLHRKVLNIGFLHLINNHLLTSGQ